MGLFDKVKNVLGGKKDGPESTTKAPSQVLRDAGVDPSGLKFSFGSDGTITVNGTISQETERARMVKLLAAIPGIKKVVDNTAVAAPAPKPPAAAPDAPASGAPEPAAEAPAGMPSEPEGGTEAVGGKTYTVKSGDTLWKIASHFYGDGSKYPKIFEANRHILEDPDRIFPGQELRIPEA